MAQDGPLPAAGVALLPDATTAFHIRADSARAARHTLDLQYYMWRGDVTGQLLAAEILAAADRGVVVRLLLDDVYALGRERVLGALDMHPNIAVRLFNATRWRRFGRLGLLLEIAFGGWHLNRRMHNKNWIMDGRLAIVGGRNIGDEYFDQVEEGAVAFRDLDIAIMGEAASQAMTVFNRYWNSNLSRPAAKVTTTAALPRSLPALRRELALACARHEAAAPMAPPARPPPRWLDLTEVEARCIQVVADPPDKARRGLRARKRARAAGGIAAEIADALRVARHEALLISPYFVPGRAGLALLRDLRARGVRVSVVTNSLAATDVVAVHGGYAKYRPALLDCGVSLFELKPTPSEERASLLGSRGASLHTKALVVDGVLAFVGSFNLDPRSAALNTEMGAFVRHRRVASEVAAEHARLAQPSRSWRVVWEDGRLGWRDHGGKLWQREPMAGIWRRATAALVRRLPVEEQL
jgi:putative cardiolipin synthase